MNTSSASTFSVASTFITTRPGPTPTMCTIANSQTAVIASSVCRENVSGTYGSGMTKNGVEFAAPGINRSSTTIRKIALAAMRARETGDKRRPSGHEAGERPVRLAQIHVLAAGARPQRRQLGVRHGPEEREHAAGNPR